ncbi:RES domain-containing protein [Rhodobacteraceae bacterium B1Z28]|uniref:RES domain-containing protein n=1 Tax=Ruegeria haliotis TaxID=2747601 RepID=A0ABX2PS82_9RHOB|nr:RES domain-containing protein [Ruegeria haliotis]
MAFASTQSEFPAASVGGGCEFSLIHPEFHDPDDSTYPEPQKFSSHVRTNGDDQGVIGIRYQSARRAGHDNWVCFVSPAILDVTQARHFDIDVRPTGKVIVHSLT